MQPEWTSMLSVWQWAALLAVPPAIIALYFLKLKRLPMEVPSTYLWRKSIEDLHVNSLWQRLRRSLLLFMQLLILLLAILALANPSWRGRKLSGDRFIFLVDNSASMGAADVATTRLDEAKRQVSALIDEMKSGDVAMLVSFSDGARVEQLFTDNRKELQRRLQAIELTDAATSLDEALRVASGLANPGRAAFDMSDIQVAEPLKATLYIFSDGKFPDVKGFSLGYLTPVFVPVGQPDAGNIGIVAFRAQRNEERPDQLQVFARLENFSPREATVELSLYLDETLLDADRLTLPAGEAAGTVFDLGDLAEGVLELRAETGDALAIDDRAWTTIGSPRRARMLLITPGNEPLRFALSTGRARELAEVTTRTPDFLAQPDYQRQAEIGDYDLFIYDRCAPQQMPRGNTFFLDSRPPGDAWTQQPAVDVPQIIDTERTHPLMQLIELGDVWIAEATPLDPPPGGTVLIDSSAGALFAIAPRDGFEDAVAGFNVWGSDGPDTNWAVRPSFPVFVMNVLSYLGGSRGLLASGAAPTGEPVVLKLDTPADRIDVLTPADRRIEVPRGRQNAFTFTDTSRVGVYRVNSGGDEIDRFAVNLVNREESDIRPRAANSIQIGWTEVTGQSGWEAARRDIWKLLLLAALAVLLAEWYIFNRRVYL